MRVFFASLLIIATSVLNADDKPEWTLKPPDNDTVYKYYVGRASGINETDAYKNAYEDALYSAINENYGINTKIESSSYTSLDKAVSTKHRGETSSNVKVIGFIWVDSYLESKADIVNLWVLYKYPKAEIIKEKDRLAGLQEEKSDINFLEGGKLDIPNTEILEITTKPEGSKVFLDGEKLWSTTPLKLGVPAGIHTIQIDNEKYDTITEKVIIESGKTKRLDYVLSPAFGKVSIYTEPTGAKVFLNGKLIGISPIPDYSVLAGENHILQITHIEAANDAKEINIPKNDSKILDIKLLLKPAYVYIYKEPIDAEVVVDGKKYLNSPITVESGEHILEISKDGYQMEYINFIVRGGEIKQLPIIKLIPISEVEKQHLAEIMKQEEIKKEKEKRLENFAWEIEPNVGYLGSSIKVETNTDTSQMGLDFRKLFWGFFSIGTSLNFLYGKSSGDNYGINAYKLSGVEISANMRLYFYNKCYLEPVYGLSQMTYTNTKEGDGYYEIVSIEQKFKQRFYAINIGYNGWFSENVGWNIAIGVKEYLGTQGMFAFNGFTGFIIRF